MTHDPQRATDQINASLCQVDQQWVTVHVEPGATHEGDPNTPGHGHEGIKVFSGGGVQIYNETIPTGVLPQTGMRIMSDGENCFLAGSCRIQRGGRDIQTPFRTSPRFQMPISEMQEDPRQRPHKAVEEIALLEIHQDDLENILRSERIRPDVTLQENFEAVYQALRDMGYGREAIAVGMIGELMIITGDGYGHVVCDMMDREAEAREQFAVCPIILNAEELVDSLTEYRRTTQIFYSSSNVLQANLRTHSGRMIQALHTAMAAPLVTLGLHSTGNKSINEVRQITQTNHIYTAAEAAELVVMEFLHRSLGFSEQRIYLEDNSTVPCGIEAIGTLANSAYLEGQRYPAQVSGYRAGLDRRRQQHVHTIDPSVDTANPLLHAKIAYEIAMELIDQGVAADGAYDRSVKSVQAALAIAGFIQDGLYTPYPRRNYTEQNGKAFYPQRGGTLLSSLKSFLRELKMATMR